jgi:hypothetical protein
MPKTEIDYSNTIIYKITCKDKAITDVYVGHTTNFVQRKHAHKQCCKNNKSAKHNCKLYEVIRANGGWINWSMEIVNFYNCADHYAARKKEYEHFIELSATLNSIEPFPKPKVIIKNDNIPKQKVVHFCNSCNIYSNGLKAFEHHKNTPKHKKSVVNTPNPGMATIISPKLSKKFACECCHYECNKESEFNKHLATRKHTALIHANGALIKKPTFFTCIICNKKYKSNVGLWKHKKKCIPPPANIEFNIKEINNPISNAEISFLTNLVLEVVKNNTELQKQTNEIYKQNTELQKQNHEFQKQIIDVCKKGTSNIYQTNSHNKTFNLQVFLNEQCKDAMNIMDFVDSMTLDFADLEDVGRLGYVEGLSNIIIRKLNELDVYKRPIHCSDGKREIMYVKDDNVWEKENDNYDRLRKAIKHITKKNGDLMIPWSKEHPSCMDIQHKMNDVYLQIMSQSMGGKESFLESENKIMKKIAKAVLIDK